jgi:hypothetical protein
MGTQLTNWAESNNLVLLMPQVAPDLLADPAACWDWMAYTNGNFATREGVQMHMVRKMIEFYAGI